MADPSPPLGRLKPPFTYFGGKTMLAPRIASLLPPHEHYIEPFAGSLAVLLSKPLSRMETVSDLDGQLVNFWRQLRDNPGQLERACALTPHSRAEHAGAFSQDDCDDLERARRVWVLLTQGRGGQTGWRKTGWRYYQNPRGSNSSMPDYLSAYVSRICPAAARLAKVSIETLPALDMIRRYGQHPGCLLYCDPPYLHSVRSARSWDKRGYAAEMTEDEHRELLDALLECKASVVLSGYASSLYDEALSGWSRTEIPTSTGNGGGDRRRTEIVWSNRPFPQDTLFTAEAAP